jgi:hypothetical protein
VLEAAGVPFVDQNGEGQVTAIMLSKFKDYVGCIVVLFGMSVALLAAEPWSFYNIMQLLVFDYSPNQPLTGLGLAIAALGGVILAHTDCPEK